jgi:hypothetical protein
MTDNNRDRLPIIPGEKIQKGFVPDKAVLPPINVPQPTSSSSSSSTTTTSTSSSGNASTEKK